MNATNKTAPAEADIQWTDAGLAGPEPTRLRDWAESAARAAGSTGVITLRVIGLEEMHELNLHWRGGDYSTNVLSFPFELPTGLPPEAIDPILGDILICAPVLEREAREQGKTLEAHWAHIVVHGVLHLLGHDHEQPEEADIMEGLEIAILADLGYANPYEVEAHP